MGNLSYMQVVPKIRKEFLKELLGILGKPQEVYLRVWHKQENLGDMTLKEGFAERSCDCSIENILKLYDENTLERKKPRKYDVAKITWYDFSKDEFYHGIEFWMDFTPCGINLKINSSRVSSEKFISLLGITNKYRVANNINLIFDREVVKQVK